jgi:hypothetical protein
MVNKDQAILALRLLIFGPQDGENAGWGLKNVPWNFAVLPNPHNEHFHENGEWMLVPIYKTLDDLKRWKEDEEYWALVIAGSTRGGGATVDKSSEISSLA